MMFEYDPVKSEANLRKHGIDFEQAQALWDDELGVEIPAKSETEKRIARIASFRNKLWIAFYTIRDKNIRLISVRRARKGEETLYDSRRT